MIFDLFYDQFENRGGSEDEPLLWKTAGPSHCVALRRVTASGAQPCEGPGLMQWLLQLRRYCPWELPEGSGGG
jgi:hypothetical protein